MSGPDGSELRRTALDNGLRVVSERLPWARSVTVGFWVGVGARDEPDELAGASHLLEHLLFKGTASHTARDIAEAVDTVGGEMNAFTSREYTLFYVRVPEGSGAMALDLLSEVVWRPALRPADVEAERQVVLEELLVHEDTPEERVSSLLGEVLFPDHPLGREVLGTTETVASIDRDAIAAFHRTHYRPRNVVVAVSGVLEHDEVVDALAAASEGLAGGETPRRSPPRVPVGRAAVLRRPTEQAHLTVGLTGLTRDDDDRFALGLVNQALGGGLSSRLFQEIREERGLAYSVYSWMGTYADAGEVGVYAGTGPRRAQQVVDLLHEQLDRLTDGGLSEQELAVAKGSLEGSLTLGLEDTAGRMARLGRGELLRGEVLTIEEVLRRYQGVTPDDVDRVVRRVFAAPRVVAAVGPLDHDLAPEGAGPAAGGGAAATVGP